MFSIIHTLEIWKAVTDDNIDSAPANKRRESFDLATDLITLADVEIVLDGIIYGLIHARLEDIHKLVINKHYRINDATTGLSIGTVQSVNEVAKIEAKLNHVIIICENPSNHSIDHHRIVCVTPTNFIEKIEELDKFSSGIVVQSLISKYGKKSIYNSGLQQIFFKEKI